MGGEDTRCYCCCCYIAVTVEADAKFQCQSGRMLARAEMYTHKFASSDNLSKSRGST